MTRTWNKSENAELTVMFYDNKSANQMAERFKCSTLQVYSRCRNLNLYFRDRKRISEDYTKPAAKHFNKDHRICLKCEQTFLSDGPGNRICGPCATSNYGYIGVMYG